MKCQSEIIKAHAEMVQVAIEWTANVDISKSVAAADRLYEAVKYMNDVIDSVGELLRNVL